MAVVLVPVVCHGVTDTASVDLGLGVFGVDVDLHGGLAGCLECLAHRAGQELGASVQVEALAVAVLVLELDIATRVLACDGLLLVDRSDVAIKVLLEVKGTVAVVVWALVKVLGQRRTAVQRNATSDLVATVQTRLWLASAPSGSTHHKTSVVVCRNRNHLYS
jgi:hypothetical protein